MSSSIYDVYRITAVMQAKKASQPNQILCFKKEVKVSRADNEIVILPSTSMETENDQISLWT